MTHLLTYNISTNVLAGITIPITLTPQEKKNNRSKVIFVRYNYYYSKDGVNVL